MKPVVKGSSAVEKGVMIEKKASSMFCGPWEESAGRWAAAGLAGLVVRMGNKGCHFFEFSLVL